MRRFLECGVVGNFLEFEYRAEVGGINEYVHDATIVGGEEFFQYKAGDEGWLSELLGTLLVGIEWERMLCGYIGNECDCLG